MSAVAGLVLVMGWLSRQVLSGGRSPVWLLLHWPARDALWGASAASSLSVLSSSSVWPDEVAALAV